MLGLFKRKHIDPKKLLAESLSDMKLPSFSAATMTSLRLLRDPTSGTDEIAGSIEANPGLVVYMLRMVNSAAFGLRRNVDRVAHAINLLGRGKVESLIVATAVKGALQCAAPRAADKRFWLAASMRASLARGIAALIHPQTQSEAFVGGLLQDMALPMLQQCHADDYVLLMRESCNGADLEDLEQERFGWDHSEIGACVAVCWQLPEVLASSIGGHHEGGSDVPPAIHLVSHVRERGDKLEIDRLVSEAHEVYNVPADRIASAVREARANAKQLYELLR